MQTPIRHKRGQKFILLETGEELFLNRIKENGDYFMDYPNGCFDSFHPDELKPVQKQRSAIASKPISNDKKSHKKDLTAFFESLKIDSTCQECGIKLNCFTQFALRSVCCHILPKAYFESIATKEENILFMGVDFMGGCGHHDKWDSSVSNRKSMNVYSIALDRYESLKQFLTDAEIVKADKYLGL